MKNAYLGFATLTNAQRARELLSGRGLRVRLVRMVSEPGVSCAFGLKIAAAEANQAVRILKIADLLPVKTIMRNSDGS